MRIEIALNLSAVDCSPSPCSYVAEMGSEVEIVNKRADKATQRAVIQVC